MTPAMKTSDFDYLLPESYIAQTPLEPRDSSRLLVLNRETGNLEHKIFRQLGDYLRAGDLLVLNRTRVIPARLFARKATGGRVELLLLRRRDELTWEALVGGNGMRIGTKVRVEDGPLAEITEILDGSERLIHFIEPIEPYFPKAGNVPLPPYIHEKLSDPERYQTVYAREPGSAAAPTAGLHFTPRLLDELKGKGVETAEVTLHVGLDTFAPVKEDQPEEHRIHSEWCELTSESADRINQTRHSGGRIIAVGTTTVRTLESSAIANRQSPIENRQSPIENRQSKIVTRQSPIENRKSSLVTPFSGPTNLFILPGHPFKVVDAMITNFHLPKSTLLMLVSAFAGREKILETYQAAIHEGYRFYSFGDAMLIV
jgi:S-adenosylmethionine:tRNA ribosyltransferase-isomerase